MCFTVSGAVGLSRSLATTGGRGNLRLDVLRQWRGDAAQNVNPWRTARIRPARIQAAGVR